ncbi:MAG: hypothetical protein K5867_04190 [Bacteroidales bacterium]|nr:hypothetical protein [Bacteroidales bacterium]
MKKEFKPNQYLDPFEGKLGQRITEEKIRRIQHELRCNEEADREQQKAIDQLGAGFKVVNEVELDEYLKQGSLRDGIYLSRNEQGGDVKKIFFVQAKAYCIVAVYYSQPFPDPTEGKKE